MLQLKLRKYISIIETRGKKTGHQDTPETVEPSKPAVKKEQVKRKVELEKQRTKKRRKQQSKPTKNNRVKAKPKTKKHCRKPTIYKSRVSFEEEQLTDSNDNLLDNSYHLYDI